MGQSTTGRKRTFAKQIQRRELGRRRKRNIQELAHRKVFKRKERICRGNIFGVSPARGGVMVSALSFDGPCSLVPEADLISRYCGRFNVSQGTWPLLHGSR